MDQHQEEFDVEDGPMSAFERMKYWIRYDAPWFMCSLTAHVVVLLVLALFAKGITDKKDTAEAPALDEVKVEEKKDPPPPPPTDIQYETPKDETPGELTDESLSEQPATDEKIAMHIDDSPGFEAKGGGVPSGTDSGLGAGGLDIKDLGRAGSFAKGAGGIGAGLGTGNSAGSGGDGSGIGGRGFGHQDAMAASGGTKRGEVAVQAALAWLAKHQSPDGSWSLKDYTKQCKDATCSGQGSFTADAAGTAMGVLPFLAAGQTHKKGTYSPNVNRALYWLMAHQKDNGDLGHAASGNGHMYSHALASIALCEAAAMERSDNQVKAAAQKAIGFILATQNAGSGGWRYNPGEDGDTSVVGWMVMALKSAEMAYLNVDPKGFEGAKKWLASCTKPGAGGYGAEFAYRPENGSTDSMTAVGLLCGQYMKMFKAGDPKMNAGVDYLQKPQNQPNGNNRNIYYWYYATQVMHNVLGPEWDDWNRKMRRILIDSQNKTGCSTGSWDPDKPTKDRWGTAGGRVMMTSLSTLTLEVHYRYLPLFKLDNEKDLNKLPGLNEKGEEVKRAAGK